MSAGVVLGAAVLQVTNTPDEWPRTAGGAARRLGDQAGFVAIRSITHDQLRRAIPWTASVFVASRVGSGLLVAVLRRGLAARRNTVPD